MEYIECITNKNLCDLLKRRNSMKKGFWTIICILILVFSKEGFADSIWVCSNCGQQVKAILGDVCPYCGAKLAGDEE